MITLEKMVRTVLVVLCILLISTSTFGQRKRIMLVGDSIIKGSTGSINLSGFRRYLHILLTGNGYNIDFVGSQGSGKPTDFDKTHEGYAGWFADHAHDTSVDKSVSTHIYDWLKKTPTDILFLHIGTNDIDIGDSAEQLIKEIEIVLDEIHRYQADNFGKVTVVLAQIINRGDKLDGSPESKTTTQYNTLLKTMISSRFEKYPNDKIVLTNLETGTNLNYNIDNTYPYKNGDMFDILHPNDNGYKKIAREIYKTLKSILTPDSSPDFYLISPANGALDQKDGIKLTWNSLTGAATYRLQVSDNENFETLLVDENGITDTTKIIEVPADTTQYYWRTIAVNSAGSNIEYSTSWSFKTGILTLTEPVLITPEDNALNQPTTLALKWSSLPAARSYTIELSTDPTFSSGVISDTGLTDTIKQIQGLNNGTLYFWRIIANSYSDTTIPSKTRSFVTSMMPPENLEASRNPSGTVTLTWTDNQQNEVGFILERKSSNDNAFTTIDSVAANTTSYNDSSVNESTFYYYRIKAYNQFEESDYSNIDTAQIVTSVENTGQIKDYSLSQNYPNPFNPETVISYQIPAAGRVELKIFDILGREIITLVDKEQNPGKYEISFNGNELTSGIYLYKLKTNNYVQIKKMMLLK